MIYNTSFSPKKHRQDQIMKAKFQQVQTKYFPCIADARMYFFQEGYLTVDTDFYHEKMKKIVNLEVVGEVYIDQSELTKAKAREFHKVI